MDCHVVKLPLRTNARDEHILEQRRRARAQLKNATQGSLVRRGRAMLRDPDFASARRLPRGSAQRTRAFRELRSTYGLAGTIDAQREAARHWRKSRWLPLVIDSRAADAVGAEALLEVNEWLYGNRGEPKARPLDQQDTIWGWGSRSGLRFSEAEGVLIWPHVGSRAPDETPSAYNINRRLHGAKRPSRRGRRRGLKLPLAKRHGPGSRTWENRVGHRRIIRAGVKREMVRGRLRWSS